MSLAVIGGSNFLGRFLIRNLESNYGRIALGDFYPQRPSVYALQEALGGKLTKRHLSFKIDLDRTLEGADEVWVVTHDYFKLALAKTFYIDHTAKIAKKLGAKKLKIIAPLELDHLDPILGDSEAHMQESIDKARQSFPDLSVVKTNLIFGTDALSLLFQHTLNALSTGDIIATHNGGRTQFQPVHQNVVLDAVKNVQPGASEIVAGPQVLAWRDITKILSDYADVGQPDHEGVLKSLHSRLATSWAGDALYPSHFVQLSRLLLKDRTPTPTIVAGPTLSETLKPKELKGFEKKAWHQVIVD
mmetsp:Transcript_26868/g.48431  ORF Transcript_26868/g.48431 Transcript_26868/m.48431 type:complete len:302 (-) Transcript_26868:274-1179(-)